MTERARDLAGALRLEYFTIGWNLVEGGVSVAAAMVAGSVALLGFGIDSFIESASAMVLVWRLRAEANRRDTCAVEALERRALRLVGASFFALAAWVAFDASRALIAREMPSTTVVGLAVPAVSIAVMWLLARAKRVAASRLQSGALAADATQTTACWYLSFITLGGLGLHAALGWWWADPVAGLGMTIFLVREGREAWRGETCCD